MTDSAIAARLIDALESAADREAGVKTALVSATVDVLARADTGTVETKLVRKTRTLVFVSADFVSDAGALIASASSLHKVAP